MGAPANYVWLPLLLMANIIMALAQSTETTKFESSSPSSRSSSTTISTSTDADVVIGGDLQKGARVEQMAGGEPERADTAAATPKTENGGPYDVIDVLAATSAGVGRPKSGQTTRIYTTGDVNDDFWLKHLGDDFKHAIHLQVGGTNDDYNRIINQTRDGIHEEVHHEYLPGAERPPEAQQQQPQQQQQQRGHSSLRGGAGYGHPNLVSQLSLDGEAMALKDNYMRQQEQQHQRYSQGYAAPNSNYNTHNTHNRHRHTYTQQEQQQQQHNTPHTHHTHNTYHTPMGKSRHGLRNRYKPNNGHNPAQQSPSSPSSGIINSSEDTLHVAQSQAAPTSSISPGSGTSVRRDDMDSQLPFKSPFNDYGSRPTRDLTYLLYRRGL